MDETISIACEYAKSFLGVRYRWGGETPMGGFDCSGLVQEILAGVGYTFGRDHNSKMMFDHFVRANAFCLPTKGSLAFYGTSGERIRHVSFMITDRLMIEAAGGGSRTHSVDEAIDAKAYVKLRPFDRRSDFVHCFMPAYVPA